MQPSGCCCAARGANGNGRHCSAVALPNLCRLLLCLQGLRQQGPHLAGQLPQPRQVRLRRTRGGCCRPLRCGACQHLCQQTQLLSLLPLRACLLQEIGSAVTQSGHPDCGVCVAQGPVPPTVAFTPVGRTKAVPTTTMRASLLQDHQARAASLAGPALLASATRVQPANPMTRAILGANPHCAVRPGEARRTTAQPRSEANAVATALLWASWTRHFSRARWARPTALACAMSVLRARAVFTAILLAS
mmetsp:Transcript_26164/g.55381  ORF Transcript_26164/g.55381 Transcript_26164/m.55381 type:complete len:247 (-) Transcript_26164:1237-1977(-)